MSSVTASSSTRDSSIPTETSPLLSKPDPGLAQIAPEPIAQETEDEIDNDEHYAADDGGDIERQITNESHSDFQGLPDVQKRMWYIFPALAIGVSIQLRFHPFSFSLHWKMLFGTFQRATRISKNYSLFFCTIRC